MNQNWFLHVQGIEYGPFPFEELVRMVGTGQVQRDTLVYHTSTVEWVPAESVNGLFAQTQVPFNQVTPNGQAIYYSNAQANISPPPKKKGCFRIGCLFFVLIFVGIIVFFVLRAFNIIEAPRPNNLHLEKSQVVSNEKLKASGDELVVDDGSDIDGMRIEMPEGAYEKDTKFTVSTRQITEHEFGPNFEPITPLITVKNGDQYSEEPMTVTIPIEKSDNEFALAFYYTKEGTLEALPLLYEDNTQIVVATKHFSDLVVSKVDEALLNDVNLDTGFMPGTDDWSFLNTGSTIVPGGFCAGQTISMAYYYFEKRLKGAAPLYTTYDNNHEALKTPALDRDDSLGIRLASVVHKSIDWGAITRKYTREYGIEKKYIPDRLMYDAFAYAMLITKEPQYVGINVRSFDANNKVKLEAGHAILAYRITKDKIYVADPNFPGEEGRFIPFDGTNFGIYESKTSVNAPSLMYNSFALYAKTALVNWAAVGALFKELDQPTPQSTIGDAQFPTMDYSVYTDADEDGLIETNAPEMVMLDEMIIQRIKDKSDDIIAELPLPADFKTKDYVVIIYQSQEQNCKLTVYKGTQVFGDYKMDTDQRIVFIPIEKGMNDIGLYYTKFRQTEVKNGKSLGYFEFVDFIRFDVVNGEEDLTGTWEGTMTITDIGKVMAYAQTMGEQIVSFIVKTFLKEIIKTPITEEQIKEAVASSIEVNEDIYKPMPVTLQLEKTEKGEYTGNFTSTTPEGLTQSYPATVKYENAYLTIETTSEDGSKLKFKLGLYDNKTLAGTFGIDAWGSIQEGVKGDSTLIKK